MAHEGQKSVRAPRLHARLLVGPIALGLLFVLTGFLSHINITSLSRNAADVTRTHSVLLGLQETLSLLKDAETGQRGFILTGQEEYLQPFSAAVPSIKSRINQVEQLLAQRPDQLSRMPTLRSNVDAKIAELQETIALRRSSGVEAAMAVVLTDRGREFMDRIRDIIGELTTSELELRRARIAEMENSFQVALASGVTMGVTGLALACVIAMLMQRTAAIRARHEWIQSGLLELNLATAGDLQLGQVGEGVLRFFRQYLGAEVGAFFIRDGQRFRRVAAQGVPHGHSVPTEFDETDGLLGQATKDRKIYILDDIPDGYLAMGSSLGEGKPRHLVIVPAHQDGYTNSIFEVGSLRPFPQESQELLQRAMEQIGSVVKAANYRDTLQQLLEETQQQAEELQAQGEELRVSNEELEEQSRALRQSQTRLELQQAELEQTNSQLEEQALMLESQRDEVTRAKVELQIQASELERASRYKSDFLANMSHELRTPLNSSLILARLLADNAEGNLSAEQVRYAKTIEGAGNDLLMLINDILDLSKIEAGYMEIQPTQVRVGNIVDNLTRTFRPIADEKHLAFKIEVAPNCPPSLHTDAQRLQQILKNLLSNALKFTETGEVSLSISPTNVESILFSVHDTGIGIAEDKQNLVFEAFRQADGTTNRKFGGTGLGLSIARELARLLGGRISLESQSGVGSTFTLEVPLQYEPLREAVSEPVRIGKRSSSLISSANPAQTHSYPGFDDDREKLSGERIVILVVEDDQRFAEIVYNLAHEMRFDCLVAMSGGEGMLMAVQYRPAAILLDIALPDSSGLALLDRLKHDSRTRHIPVHIVSAFDYTETALSLGAIGYLQKPIRKEDLIHAFEKLQMRLDNSARRVLVVEDDPVQLESLQKLLQTQTVETVGASTAAECLAALATQSFDCMVLDLSLPDESGYSLLEKLSREDAYSFPPVIVYTGRDLTIEEEHRLRRYSKSIIIKGAKSPERLLDEVTLFLHQVVTELPPEKQQMIDQARSRDAALEGKRILLAEDDVRNVFAVTSVLEPHGVIVEVARNGRDAISALERGQTAQGQKIDLVLMDVMMPEMDGLTAMREIRRRNEWSMLPIIALTAKAMRNDQEECLQAGANDYMSKPLDVERLLSLIRVWLPRS